VPTRILVIFAFLLPCEWSHTLVVGHNLTPMCGNTHQTGMYCTSLVERMTLWGETEQDTCYHCRYMTVHTMSVSNKSQTSHIRGLHVHTTQKLTPLIQHTMCLAGRMNVYIHGSWKHSQCLVSANECLGRHKYTGG